MDGRLHIEGVDLSVLAGELDGRPAFVLSRAAVHAALARQPGTCTIPVGSVGPPALLALLAEAGCWARAVSSHELSIALAAGFRPAHVIAGADLLDDGFIKDALTAGVGMLLRPDRETALNVARIAGALDLRQPAAEGAPPDVPADTFNTCGGLLAPLLRGPPEMVLDAPWQRVGRALPRLLALREPPRESLPAAALASAPRARRKAAQARRPVRLAGLGATVSVPARLTGLVERGDWVAVVAPDAAAVHVPHPAWPMPRTVLVREDAWSVLEERPLPS